MSNNMTFQAVSLFTKNLLYNFNTIGEITPYSRFTSRKIVECGKIQHAKSILEIGPGLGKFTKDILSESSINSKITIVEKLTEFSNFLTSNFNDKRLKVINGDILDENVLIQLEKLSFDVIISSIPLSFLKTDQRIRFSNIIKDLLKPTGVFINAQYSLSPRRYFNENDWNCNWKLELRNIPPTFIHICQKR